MYNSEPIHDTRTRSKIVKEIIFEQGPATGEYGSHKYARGLRSMVASVS